MRPTCTLKHLSKTLVSTFVILLVCGVTTAVYDEYVRLDTDEEISQKSGFVVYCYHGNKKPLTKYLYVFGSLEVEFYPATGVNNCDLIVAENETLVHRMRDTPNPLMSAWKQIWQSLSSFNPTTDHVKLSPFTKTCFGLEGEDVTIKAKLRMYDPRYLGLFIIGVILFFQADRLSRSLIFYYGTGVSAGVILSLLIIVYVMGKFVPAKKAMVAFVLFGWSFSLYFIKWLWNKIIIERALPENTHFQVVFGYIALSALVSFAVCYRYGPVTEQRTLNLIKWTIWLGSWLLIYNGTQIPEVSISIIVILWTWSIMRFPVLYVGKNIRRKWLIWFPTKRKLLTEDEYLIEGHRATKRALKELREYCNSSDCDAWKVISKLESPSRFSKFIRGKELHITDEEYASHVIDSDTSFDLPRDDDDDDDYFGRHRPNISESGED
ncbi:nuclear envelope integral membrane protein 1-like [Glandiceps talaboti]